MLDKDLKLLWGRAAGRCSMPECRIPLALPGLPAGRGSVIGRMAHIVARSPGGPRGRGEADPSASDVYENLVLLCPTHHSMVDADPITWTVERLQEVKRSHEVWVTEGLRTGLLRGDIEEVLYRIGRSLERRRLLPLVLKLDVGNSRYLAHLQASDDYWWFTINADARFRDEFLNFLDETYFKPRIPAPFSFEALGSIVAFPEGYEIYAAQIRNPPLQRPTVPVLVDVGKLVEDKGRYFLEQCRFQPVPDLPIRNGFIHSLDVRTGLPNAVGDDPSQDHWGAYYWVKSSGLRLIVVGIGVVDPLESWEGMAIWWSPDESPPVRARTVQDATPELDEEMQRALRKFYQNAAEFETRWSGNV